MSRKEIIPNPSSVHNVLSAGTTLTGNLVTGDDIRIDGTIEGDVVSKGKIIIGTNGHVTGNVECQNLDLMGKILGNILCSDILFLRATAILVGNIETKVLEIEPGASFTGACQMHG